MHAWLQDCVLLLFFFFRSDGLFAISTFLEIIHINKHIHLNLPTFFFLQFWLLLLRWCIYLFLILIFNLFHLHLYIFLILMIIHSAKSLVSHSLLYKCEHSMHVHECLYIRSLVSAVLSESLDCTQKVLVTKGNIRTGGAMEVKLLNSGLNGFAHAVVRGRQGFFFNRWK